jgi:Tol biopolymer transport system component
LKIWRFKMQKKLFLITLVLMLLLTGCGMVEIGFETPQPSLAAATNTPESTPTMTPEPFTYNDLPGGTLLDPSLAGMVYRDDQGVWVVDSAGQSRFIGERNTSPVLSPNGEQVLFTSDDETVLWLRDLPSGESRILDDTPGKMKREYSWWPARPNVIIYALVDPSDPWMGTLGGMDLDTGETFLLDPNSPSEYALSPDGESIVLGARESLRIYHWGGDTQIIVPDDFKLEGWNLTHASWSPDGTKISLFGSRYNEAAIKTELIVAILDPQDNSTAIIYSYQANLGGEYPFTTSWSPDGQWITATTFGELGGRLPALWVFAVDGSEKYQFPYGTDPIWSSDGSQLIYLQGPEPDAENSSYLAYNLYHVQIGEWQAQQLPTAPGSSPQDWVSVP